MDFDSVGFLPVVVVEEDHVGSEDRLTMAFKVADFFSNEFVDCAGEGYVSRSDVDLHGISVSRGSW